MYKNIFTIHKKLGMKSKMEKKSILPKGLYQIVILKLYMIME